MEKEEKGQQWEGQLKYEIQNTNYKIQNNKIQNNYKIIITKYKIIKYKIKYRSHWVQL